MREVEIFEGMLALPIVIVVNNAIDNGILTLRYVGLNSK